MPDKIYKKFSQSLTEDNGSNTLRIPLMIVLKLLMKVMRPSTWKLQHRYNKMRGEYVAISASRNARPFLPKRVLSTLPNGKL